MPSAQRNPFGMPRRAVSRRAGRCAVLLGMVTLLYLTSCSTARPTRQVRARDLETATTVEPRIARRAVVSDLTPIQDLYHPLGQRLGLIQIRNERQWRRLARVAPGLGPAPDFSHGMVVGITSNAGLPLDGSWPVTLDDVRVLDGAGLLAADFAGGSFLADTSTYLETAYIEGLAAVLIVDVNGVRFYPQ